MESTTTAIAVYGAIVATLSLAASVWLGVAELNRHKPRLKITANTGCLLDGNDKSSEPLVMIEAINTGAGKIHITGIGWFLSNGHRWQVRDPYLLKVPFDLAERKKATFHYACRWLRDKADTKEIAGAYFKDETGRECRRRTSRKTLRRWAGMTSDGWLIQWEPRLKLYYREDGPGQRRTPLGG